MRCYRGRRVRRYVKTALLTNAHFKKPNEKFAEFPYQLTNTEISVTVSLYTVGKKSIHTSCFLLIPFYYIEQIYINDAFIKNIYW
jgi:hypothetical protein